jgi:hypothetical protein
MRCHTVRERFLEFETPPSRRERRHLAGCAACQAEWDRYESVDEGLRALEARTAIPPAGLEQELAAIPSRFGRRGHLLRNRTTVAGSVAVAAAAAAYWRTRSRRLAAA